MNGSDKLRAALPRLAAQMNDRLAEALRQIETVRATNKLQAGPNDELARAWRKGLRDALALLTYAREAQERFEAAAREAADDVGITAEERLKLFA